MTQLSDALRDEYETELSRLGSSKVLFALTGGEMDEGPVTAVAAGRAAARADTLEEWATDADGDAAALFSTAAEAEREYADSLGADAEAEPSPVEEVLRGLETPDERLGGLLAATLVEKRITEQVVGFFVGQANPRAAGDVRDHVGALEDRLAELEDLADDAGADAGERVVEAAYGEYVDRLEAQGVNPKPVC